MELVSELGHTVWSANYTGFGQAKVVNGSAVRNAIRYQGQYSDDEIGLHYNRFRYYDPSSGQYTQNDPLGLEGGDLLNQYVSNPVGWIDPLGLQGVCPKTYKEYRAKGMTAQQAYKAQKSPIHIPAGAKAQTQPKQGYNQIKYTWKDKGQSYEARWHTETPGAPKGSGSSWVVNRKTPGNSQGVRSKTDVLTKVNESTNRWVPKSEWQAAINARKAGTGTSQQAHLLDSGHFR